MNTRETKYKHCILRTKSQHICQKYVDYIFSQRKALELTITFQAPTVPIGLLPLFPWKFYLYTILLNFSLHLHSKKC